MMDDGGGEVPGNRSDPGPLPARAPLRSPAGNVTDPLFLGRARSSGTTPGPRIRLEFFTVSRFRLRLHIGFDVFTSSAGEPFATRARVHTTVRTTGSSSRNRSHNEFEFSKPFATRVRVLATVSVYNTSSTSHKRLRHEFELSQPFKTRVRALETVSVYTTSSSSRNRFRLYNEFEFSQTFATRVRVVATI